jgi:DNA repair exonuclease SbcCD ATPase subunit
MNIQTIISGCFQSAAKLMRRLLVAGRLAGLKAKIEKLKRFDLNAAYYALGKKCYELALYGDQFAAQFASITEVNQRIESKREAVAPSEKESTGDKIKRVSAHTKKAVEAEALRLKLKQLLSDLGRQVAALGQHPNELTAEIDAIEAVNDRIAREETAYASLAAENGDTPALERLLAFTRDYPRTTVAIMCIVLIGLIISVWHIESGRNAKAAQPEEAKEAHAAVHS